MKKQKTGVAVILIVSLIFSGIITGNILEPTSPNLFYIIIFFGSFYLIVKILSFITGVN